jgi:MFS family permease
LIYCHLGKPNLTRHAQAVPSITTTFHNTADIGWYGAAYPLTLCSVQLLAGKVYAQFPQKIVFLVFFGLFMFGSLLCGVAVNSKMFIVGRAIAGAGAAGILSGALAIVAVILPLDKQSLILGLLMSLVGTAVVLGPVISGLLTDHSTWRWCFYLNLPCGGVTLLALMLFFRPPKKPAASNLAMVQRLWALDLVGCLIFIPAVVMLLLALQWGGDGSPDHAWNSAMIIGLFCGAGVSLILFLIWEYRQGDDAMLPLRFLTDLTIISSCLYGFALLGGYVVVSYFLPEWFQIIKGANPQKSALMLLPIVITNFISKAVIGVIGKSGNPSPNYYVCNSSAP